MDIISIVTLLLALGATYRTTLITITGVAQIVNTGNDITIILVALFLFWSGTLSWWWLFYLLVTG